MLTIQNLELQNFRGIRQMTLPFESSKTGSNLTVLAAVNGGGKTTIIDALALSLSWLTARTKRDTGNGQHFAEDDIRYGENHIKLSVSTSAGRWLLAKSRKGVRDAQKSDYTELRDLADYLRGKLEHERSLPVFACYPVDRAVVLQKIPRRIRTKHDFNVISVYDEPLKGSADFKLFFEWFRDREDVENESFRNNDQTGYPDNQLQAVRNALEQFLPEYRDLRVKRKPLLRMVVTKEGQELKIDNLSTGETCFLALIGDIARRLAIANPEKEDPLYGEGIILIDEIDLHLHPSWQRRVITRLTEVFPNVQFVVTTHSPQILSEVRPESIRLLYSKDGAIHYAQPSQSYGLNSSQVLRELMDDPGMNKDVSAQLDTIAERIDQDDFDGARTLIEQLKIKLNGSIPDLVEAEATIAMLEPHNGMQE
jgi:predicted ATP-binding protein involved in virulence